MNHLLFFTHKAKAVICPRGRAQDTFIFWVRELHPSRLGERRGRTDGRMKTWLIVVGGHGRRANLFKIVREVTLRSEECWIYPQMGNRNNGAVLIVTLQSSTQWTIRGGLIRGVERWATLWKGHCTLYLEFFFIFPWTWTKGKERPKSATPVWLWTFSKVIFSPNALVK